MAIQNGFIQIIQDEKRDYQYEEAMKTLRTNIQFSGLARRAVSAAVVIIKGERLAV